MLRANQEAVVQVTPRFPGIVRSIRKRIGDQVGKDEQLASIESNQSLTVYELKAPIAGTVIDRQISLGEYASEQKPAFVVADLSTIWVDLSIYRQDLRRVRLGRRGADRSGGRPRRRSGAKISYVAPIGASETQTALARVVLPNADGRLQARPIRHARLILAKRERARRSATELRSRRWRTRPSCSSGRSDDKIEARPVELGDSDTKFVEIRAGLSGRRTLRRGEQLRGEGRDGQGGGGPP